MKHFLTILFLSVTLSVSGQTSHAARQLTTPRSQTVKKTETPMGPMDEKTRTNIRVLALILAGGVIAWGVYMWKNQD
mgnify:CR=1 FL=1